MADLAQHFFRMELTSRIQELTAKLNKDNISRTNAYKRYFDRHPEIKWSLLASFVSRNAGWSMTDLKGRLFELGLTAFQQKWLFLAYERANWLIFSDAYPRLLLYHWSKQPWPAAVSFALLIWRVFIYENGVGAVLA